MANLAERIRRHFLWLLLATYALAAALPGPGDALARWRLLPGGWRGEGARFPMLLVAVLLLLAAASIDVVRLRVLMQRPWRVLASLAGVWLAPALAVGAASLLTPLLTGTGASGLLLGLALVAAMPVANSSVGWTQQSGGDLAWSLGLVVLSILLCPWVTPGLLRLAGLALSASEAEQIDALITQLTGATFILVVLLPTAIGLATRWALTGERIDHWRAPMQLTTALVLLLLNYANGARVTTAFQDMPPAPVVVLAAALAALALSLAGVAFAWLLADLLRLDGATQTALGYGLSMKHTGLGLALAVSVLDGQPLAGLLIAVATPMQHLVASVLDWRVRGQKPSAAETAAG